jgi:ATP-dependent Clp protease ATP-binding subunit ClpA
VAAKLHAEPEDGAGDSRRLLVTGPARESVHFAREEAEALGALEIAPEHLLVGLLRDERGPVVRALDSVGVSLPQARDEVARLRARGRPPRAKAVDPSVPGERPRVSAATRDVMEQAVREAVGRRDGHLGVEHLLLALLRDRRAVPARTLIALGAAADEVERALDEVLGRG